MKRTAKDAKNAKKEENKVRWLLPHLLLSSIAFLGSLPAMAGLGDVWTDFQYYANDFKNYLNSNISEMKPLESQSQTAIANSNGALNIPNPNAAAKSVKDGVIPYSISSKYENNSAVFGMIVGNEVQRQITRASVDGVLGSNGQSKLKGQLQNTQITVSKVSELANTASINKKQKEIEIQAAANGIGNLAASTLGAINPSFGSMLSSQSKLTQLTWEGLADLELQNINIQNQQSKIAGETLATTISIHRDLQYSNLNLANISQQVDDANRARRVDTSAEVARLLRVTSQTDLIGRK